MKRKVLAFTLIALGFGILPLPGQTISFFKQFPTTPGIGGATVVAADAAGVYVVGDKGLRKFDSRGGELWAREFSVPLLESARHVRAAANATGVYVIGWTDPQTNRLVRKYGPGGDELWTRQLDFLPTGLGVNDTGVYVGGGVFAPFPDRGSVLRKYTAEGTQLWTRRSQEPAPSPYYGVVEVDTTGVYVFGGLSVGKWDPDGNELWSRQWGIFSPLVAAAVPTGFYVVGNLQGRPFLRRYDAGGNELWTREVAASSTGLYPGGVAADATGVYIAGTTDRAGPALPGQCRSGSSVDSFVRKYDADGAELWTREFSTSDAAWARGVSVDAAGVYVVGRVGTAVDGGCYTGSPPHPCGAFLVKFEKSPAEVMGSRPRIFPDCVVNAASYVGGGVAPGEIVTLFGSAMGPSQLVPSRVADGRLATTLGDTRILFNGVPAPLLYVSDRQSSAIVPYAVAGRTSVQVQIEYREVLSDAVTVPVLASRPGVFSLDGTGRGQALILNEDGRLNSPSNPAPRGSTITIFATGGGEVAPGVVDGQIVGGVSPRTSLPVSVVFDYDLDDEFGNGPKPGEVLYAGGSPGSVAGLLQVNVRVPPNTMVTGDAVSFALIIGTQGTVYQVTVALR